VQWHHAENLISWHDVQGGLPDLAIVTGWGFPFCRRLAKEAAAAKVPVVTMSDNRWRGDWRQWFGKYVYRALYANTFCGGWVPGTSATRVLREFGIRGDCIFPCLYGANPAIFKPALPLASRDKSIIFVGQMIRRKGVDVLIEAYRRSELAQNGWVLRMFGSGPLAALTIGQLGIEHVAFSPPDVIARALGHARICVLPSRDDNWGVALHEGASAGCLLLTTTAVGASEDLLGHTNGVVTRPGDARSLAAGFLQLASIPASRLGAAEAESRDKAGRFGPNAFAASFDRICDRFLVEHCADS